MSITPSLLPLLNNLQTITQNAHRSSSAFYLENSPAARTHVIKIRSRLSELLFKIFQALFGHTHSHRENIKSFIKEHIKVFNQEPKESYLENHKLCTDLFLAVQKYNHCIKQNSPLLSSALFDELSLNELITPESCPELSPVTINRNQITKSFLENIPKEQHPYIHEEGFWQKHQVYHYDKPLQPVNHIHEALLSFCVTQPERLLSLIGRMIEAAASIFGYKITYFNQYHYFKNQEDSLNTIYANDYPVNLTHPASYWIGHATCLLGLPIKTKQGGCINVNLITDPIEGDIHKVLYPRMTAPARTMDDAPMPHIYMLSHNHLDHYDSLALMKLVHFQPIMLVPQGDGDKFKQLGFTNIYEHNWWQSITIPLQQGSHEASITITAVPANHWSGQCLCDGHHSAFLGYVIHQEEGDIYFAGDTARLSESHINTLRDRFNIRSMFQPGGPDETRENMVTTHQSSADGLWMHFNLMVKNLYIKGKFRTRAKVNFIKETKKLRTVYMHTKTYKLGNLHYDDTDESVRRVKEKLKTKKCPEGMKNYENEVAVELMQISQSLKFHNDETLTEEDILTILEEGVIIPKIGSLTQLATA